MQRLTTVLVLLTLASGCAAQEIRTQDLPDPEDACDGNGVIPSDIKYGDGHITVKPAHNVYKKKQWRIKLKPDAGYENVLVIIKGKTADGDWIDKTAQASVDDEIYICVPDGIALGDYFYGVEVMSVGYIDPRVTVKE